MGETGTLTGRELHLVSYPDGAVRPTGLRGRHGRSA